MCQVSGRMNAQMYQEILKNHILPHLRSNMPEDSLFQHDNDPKHTSRLVRSFLEEENIHVLEWPAQSPDLNPIENLWDLVDREIRKRKPSNCTELMERIRSEWDQISPDLLVSLVDSMPNRLRAVIATKGYATKY